MTCSNCGASQIRCKNLCNACYRQTWKAKHDQQHGKYQRRTYEPIDPNDFWLWIRDGVKLAEAQDRKNSTQSKA